MDFKADYRMNGLHLANCLLDKIITVDSRVDTLKNRWRKVLNNVLNIVVSDWPSSILAVEIFTGLERNVVVHGHLVKVAGYKCPEKKSARGISGVLNGDEPIRLFCTSE